MPRMLSKVVFITKGPSWVILNLFLDAEECYSQIIGNALRDVPGPSGKKFIEAYMMSRVRNEWVLTFAENKLKA